jgi:hypothetical protein
MGFFVNQDNTVVPNDGFVGTSVISAQVSQKNVEGLEERFDKTEKALHSTINLTFEHGQKIDKLNKQNQDRFAEIIDLENNLNVFKASQREHNTKVLLLIKDIIKSLIIYFSIFVVFMLATWGYLTYTFFKH